MKYILFASLLCLCVFDTKAQGARINVSLPDNSLKMQTLVDSLNKLRLQRIADSTNTATNYMDVTTANGLVNTMKASIAANHAQDSTNAAIANNALPLYERADSATARRNRAVAGLLSASAAASTYALISSLPVMTSSTLFTQTATKTVSATTTETSLVGTGTGSINIPANPAVGKQYRLWIRGVYSTPAVSIATILVKIKVGGVTVASATINGLSLSVASYDFEGSTTFTIRANGSSGSVMTTGNIIYSAGANAAYPHIALNNGLTANTMDLTVANAIDCTITYSLAAGGNSISSLNLSLEQLN